MVTFASYSDRGGRDYNEDTVCLRQADGENLCAVLADGLGGHGGGDLASQKAAQVITGGWTSGATPDRLIHLTQEANAQILAMQTPLCRMKTTVVVLSVSPERIAYAYAGDSRLYHFAEGKLRWQSRDHSASQIAVFLGQIRPEEIRFHADRSRIFRALGQEDSPGAEGGVLERAPARNAFLLCSDGFWEYVLEAEMEQALREAATPESWLIAMRRLLENRVPPDNDNNSAIAVWEE